MPEVIREVDLRIALSHLAQTVYGTALTGTNLGAGKSFRPTAALLPEVQRTFARRGPQVFTGHEYPIIANEIELLNDVQFPLSFRLNSWLAGWLGSFICNKVTSVLEGATGHYTHTIIPSDPLAASGTRDSKVTSIYFDSGGPDATRRKMILPSLAMMRATLRIAPREEIQASIDLIGSGAEDATTTVTPPALSTEILLHGTNLKVEIGDTGGALTDFTTRLRELSIELFQELKPDLGYVPNATTPASGKFRSKMQFGRRGANLTAVFEVDRASTDLYTRFTARTRSEIKVTQDSGVVAGTGTKNHGFVFRIPDCRLNEAPIQFADGDAVYAISVPAEDQYISAGIGSVPFQLVVENDQVSYFT